MKTPCLSLIRVVWKFNSTVFLLLAPIHLAKMEEYAITVLERAIAPSPNTLEDLVKLAVVPILIHAQSILVPDLRAMLHSGVIASLRVSIPKDVITLLQFVLVLPSLLES